MSIAPTLIVVEDDADLLSYLQELLVSHRYVVYPVREGARALRLAEQVSPSLILLDLTLPDISGETLCVEFKKMYPAMPIIFLTGKDAEQDIVRGLNLGADDYITKPFTSEELLARIRARLRQPGTDPILRVDDLELNTENFTCKRGDKEIPLTHTEYSLLYYLLSNKNRVLTREMILSNVWSYTPDVDSRAVDVYIGYLRKKIDKDFDIKLIHSIRGFGYVIRDPESAVSATEQ